MGSRHVHPRTHPAESVRQLHLCPSCDSGLVQPSDWEPVAGQRWRLTLFCPNCGRLERDVFEAAEVAMFEEQVDSGVTALIDDLRVLAASNRAFEIECFGKALSHDLLLPEDF
jgi:hypothetical protein